MEPGIFLQIHKVGETPYTFFLLKQAYDEAGKPLEGKYIAKDGSIITSEEDINKHVTNKSALAPYYFGFSSKINYKNFDFGINGHGSLGNYIYNYLKGRESYDTFYSAQGTSSNVLRSTVETGFLQQRLYTDYFLEDGSFFKIDNITLGYNLMDLFNRIDNVRLSFSVQNILTVTKYSGTDPEIFGGIDRNIYQKPRVFMFGLSLNL